MAERQFLIHCYAYIGFFDISTHWWRLALWMTDKICLPTQVIPGATFSNPRTCPGSQQTNFSLLAGQNLQTCLRAGDVPSTFFHISHLAACFGLRIPHNNIFQVGGLDCNTTTGPGYLVLLGGVFINRIGKFPDVNSSPRLVLGGGSPFLCRLCFVKIGDRLKRGLSRLH